MPRTATRSQRPAPSQSQASQRAQQARGGKGRQVEEDPDEEEEEEDGDEDEDRAGTQMDVDGEENGDSVCTTFDRLKPFANPFLTDRTLCAKPMPLSDWPSSASTNGLHCVGMILPRKVLLLFCFKEPNLG